MQENSDTFQDFLRRTDLLAARLGVNVENLPDYTGISRAALFAMRKGRRPITAKSWLKLEKAEVSAGILRLDDTGPAIGAKTAESSALLKDEPMSDPTRSEYAKPREDGPLSMEERMTRVEQALQGIAAALEKLVERG